jgi:hypothetical protein
MMKLNRLLIGLTSLMLAFGMAFIGCEQSTGGGGSKTGTETKTPEIWAYTSEDGSRGTRLVLKEILTASVSAVPADGGGAAYSVRAPKSGEVFNYELYCNGVLVSSGRVTISSAASWTFTASSGGFTFSASYSGGTLTFSGKINDAVSGSDIKPVINVPTPTTPADTGGSGGSGGSGSGSGSGGGGSGGGSGGGGSGGSSGGSGSGGGSSGSGDETPTPTYSISLNKSGTHTFTTVIGAGSYVPEVLTVTITNTGNQNTGNLTVALSDGTAFAVDPSTIPGIAAGKTATFTVAPKAGLPQTGYNARVAVSGGNSINAYFDVSFTVTPPAETPTYDISLTANQPLPYTFPSVAVNYGEREALTVTVTNTGNRDTGDLTVGLNGTDSDSFTLSKTSIGSIAVSGADTFTVRPNTGLASTIHTATVTVSGDNGIESSFDVSFTVEGAMHEISLDDITRPYIFPAAVAGYYGEQTPKSVTITNRGNQTAVNLTISVSNSSAFTLSKASISSIEAGETDAFTVKPNTGLSSRNYTATVTVSGDNGIGASFNVSFTVEEARYEISLDVSGTHTFSAADASYSAQPAKNVTITNDGNVPTGELTVSVSADFEVAKASDNNYVSSITISSISISDSFKVRPKIGLTARTAPYTGTVTVDNANVDSKTFNVSFTVTIPYGIRLSANSSTFPELYEGYEYSIYINVTVYNIGRLSTGTLAIGIAEGNSEFTLYQSSISSIQVGDYSSLLVTPKTGLLAGTHTATITVSNSSNGISESVVLTFTVKQPIIYTPPVQKLFENGASSQTVNLTELGGNSVYIVKMNKGASTVAAGQTGSVTASLSDVTGQSADIGATPLQSGAAVPPISTPVSGVFRDRNGQPIVRYDYTETEPPDMPPFQHRSAAQKSGALRNMTAAVQNVVDTTTKQFWVTNELNSIGNHSYISATLRATGTHSNIWVAEGNTNSQYNNYLDTSTVYNDNKITSAQAQAMADKFDIIYVKETALFGFEYGGGLTETDPLYGGVDYDPKIQILVHDIEGDNSPSQRGAFAGYFSGNDERMQSNLPAGYKSNEMEIFYIDAYYADSAPEYIYSVLAHEFQHMIHFNRKRLTLGLNSSSSWYNEMLSMLAEDVIGPFIGIPANTNGHPIEERIPLFLGNYNMADTTVWLTGDNVSYSYANAYAFGAYLVRNFGGIKLIQRLMSNSAIDAASITAALDSDANPLRSEVASFEEALRRYGEALVFSQSADKRPSGVLSFNNTVTDTIGNTGYTFTGFNIWDIRKIVSNQYSDFGPYISDPSTTRNMPGRTMLLQSKDEWKNISGDLSITVQKPSSENIEVYVMVR